MSTTLQILASLLFSVLAIGAPPRAEFQVETEDSTPSAAATQEAALEELRELAELDLARELIPRGRALIASGGLLEESGEARALVAHALWAAGEETEALETLNRPGLSSAESAWVELERVRVHLESDQLDSAFRLLTVARATGVAGTKPSLRHPELVDAWLLLARTFARAGDLRQAANAAQEFVKRAPLHPGAPSALHLLATAAVEIRRPELASDYLKRARELERWHQILLARRLQLRRNPTAPLPRLGLGMAWMQVGAFGRALVEFETLVAEHPGYSRGWFHLGEAYRLSGDVESAYTAYGRAVETDSAQHLARFNRAILDIMGNRFEEAERALVYLVSIPDVESDPRFVEAHMHLAKIYEAAGDVERARASNARYQSLRAQKE